MISPTPAKVFHSCLIISYILPFPCYSSIFISFFHLHFFHSLIITDYHIVCFPFLSFFPQVRWVLDQEAVGGAIVGVRLGLKEHISDNKKVFSFALDADDIAAITAVQNKSKDLMTVFGDCGGEYRFRIRS